MLSSRWLSEHEGCSPSVRALCEKHFTMSEVWENSKLLDRIELWADSGVTMGDMRKVAGMLLRSVVPELHQRLRGVYDGIGRSVGLDHGSAPVSAVAAFSKLSEGVVKPLSADAVVSEYAFNTADCIVRAISCNDETLLRSVLKLYTLKLSCMAGDGSQYSKLTLWRVRRRSRRIHSGFYEKFDDKMSMPASLRW